MLHPAAAHFAVAVPIIAFVIGLAYLYKPSKLMSELSTRFMIFATIFLIVAFFTGKHDGGEVYMFISGEGQSLLKEHKQMGLYLAIAIGVATSIKIFGCYKEVFKAEILAVVLLALISGGVLFQGKMGGELTYTYGAHVEKHSDGMDCLDDPEEFLEEDE